MERDFIYLLPDGVTTAPDMLTGRTIIAEQTGYSCSSSAFRYMVKKGKVLKITKDTNSIKPQSDASNRTSATDR